MKMKRTAIIANATLITCAFAFACGGSASSAGQQDKTQAVSVGQAAGIGALLGLALGGDPIVSTIQGAALGAAGGLITNAVVEGSERSEQRKAAEQAQANQAADSENLERQVEQAIGRDNYEGYKALRSCEYSRATGLAKVGATSSNSDYRITSVWLEAMIAVDQRDTAAAEDLYAQITEADPDIDTEQQASLETDKVILQMRSERRDLGLPACR